jgi:transmembrane sensor
MESEKKYIDLELLMHKHLTGQASLEEVQIVEGILSGDTNDKLEAEAIIKSWDNALNSFPTESFNASNAFNKFKATIASEDKVLSPTKVVELNRGSQSKVLPLKKWFAVAAVFVGLVFAVSFILGDSSTYKSSNIAMSVDLQDGSSVKLAPNSSLNIIGDRSVQLEGNGYFDIISDPSKPFIVQVSEAQIEVLGTSFMIEEIDGKLCVSLQSGRLKMKSDNQLMDILPGEMAVLNEGQFVKQSVESNNAYSLSVGYLEFDKTPLRQVLLDFERHYNTSLSVRNSTELDYCTLTAPKIKAKDALDAAKIIATIYNTSVIEYKDGSIGFKELTCK